MSLGPPVAEMCSESTVRVPGVSGWHVRKDSDALISHRTWRLDGVGGIVK